jgi:NAD(P)-dependent dehydrogenase (short-subunit alcohol dehydrogenase family)
MPRKQVLIAGASGLVGYAAMRHFGADPDCDVIALSRRAPDDTHGACLMFGKSFAEFQVNRLLAVPPQACAAAVGRPHRAKITRALWNKLWQILWSSRLCGGSIRRERFGPN